MKRLLTVLCLSAAFLCLPFSLRAEEASAAVSSDAPSAVVPQPAASEVSPQPPAVVSAADKNLLLEEALRAELFGFPRLKLVREKYHYVLAGRVYSDEARRRALRLAAVYFPRVRDRVRVQPPVIEIAVSAIEIDRTRVPADSPLFPLSSFRPLEQMPTAKHSFGSVPHAAVLTDIVDRGLGRLQRSAQIRLKPRQTRNVFEPERRSAAEDLCLDVAVIPSENGVIETACVAACGRGRLRRDPRLVFDLACESGTTLAVAGLWDFFRAGFGDGVFAFPVFRHFAALDGADSTLLLLVTQTIRD